MRQRSLIFCEPNPIAHVDIAAAKRATLEMFAHWRTANLPIDEFIHALLVDLAELLFQFGGKSFKSFPCFVVSIAGALPGLHDLHFKLYALVF
jgi:hypothetical protein